MKALPLMVFLTAVSILADGPSPHSLTVAAGVDRQHVRTKGVIWIDQVSTQSYLVPAFQLDYSLVGARDITFLAAVKGTFHSISFYVPAYDPDAIVYWSKRSLLETLVCVGVAPGLPFRGARGKIAVGPAITTSFGADSNSVYFGIGTIAEAEASLPGRFVVCGSFGWRRFKTSFDVPVYDNSGAYQNRTEEVPVPDNFLDLGVRVGWKVF